MVTLVEVVACGDWFTEAAAAVLAVAVGVPGAVGVVWGVVVKRMFCAFEWSFSGVVATEVVMEATAAAAMAAADEVVVVLLLLLLSCSASFCGDALLEQCSDLCMFVCICGTGKRGSIS